MEKRWSTSGFAAGLAVVYCALDGGLRRYPDVRAMIAVRPDGGLWVRGIGGTFDGSSAACIRSAIDQI
jgi:hypothetical protein